MISKFLNLYKSKNNCIHFSPAEEDSYIRTDDYLLKHNFCKLPDEYKMFLKLTNGLIYDGIEFYGTIPHDRIEKNYTFPDIIMMCENYANYEFFTNKVVLGQISESIILYDEKSSSFAVIDRFNLRSRIECNSFAEILETYAYDEVKKEED